MFQKADPDPMVPGATTDPELRGSDGLSVPGLAGLDEERIVRRAVTGDCID
jgi:hypothetical protein